jgi:wyosine [tRNA(Phe)-imidazoG37] synthetase (radical SAM superfamily)
MPVLPLERGIVYGPVISRRLGVSLGVNLLPTRVKTCSFDCVYCHYGCTHVKSIDPPVADMPWPQEVERALEAALRRYHSVDSLTFSGNGEPTLHPAFAEIAKTACQLRDRYAPHVRLALFSNSSTVHRQSVQAVLPVFDVAMLKLDAGDPRTMAAINRPADGVRWEVIAHGLRAAQGIHVQSVLVGGSVCNTRGEAFHAWVTALAAIRPARVHIYSTEYPVAEAGVERILPYELAHIAEAVTRRTGLLVDARWLQL